MGEKGEKIKTQIDFTSKSRVLPDGRKFPETPKPQVVKETFSSVEILNIDQNEQAKKEVCAIIKNVMKDYMPADKLDKVDEIFYSCAEGYVFARKESN